MKKSFFVYSVLIAVLLVSCSSAYKTIQINSPSLTGKPDGVYRGECNLSGTPVKVILDVTVQNQTISAINIVKNTSSPVGKKALKIIDSIIERQSLNVDVISGATASSKAILKAAENALQG